VKRKVGYGGDWIDNLFLVNDKKFFFTAGSTFGSEKSETKRG